MICSPVSTCARSSFHIKSRTKTHLCSVVARGSSNFCCYSLYKGRPKTKYISLGASVSDTASCPSGINFQLYHGSFFSMQKGNFRSLSVNLPISAHKSLKGQLEISFLCPSAKMKFLVPKQGVVPDIKCTTRNLPWSSRFAYTGFIISLLVSCSNSDSVYAEASKDKEGKKNEHKQSNGKFDNEKRVYTDYSITGIPGDGRCLFRSVAHGACLCSGKPPPSESLQRDLADELRARVADEFIKRREETEWFVEGDFDTYISQIRKPHVWGGEPELFMASHVLQMPITVYMHDAKAGGLICIAEYGQEYGKENPIQVIYHGFGHYDALQIHERKGPKSKL